MKLILATAALAAMVLGTAPAQAAGCIKGAVVGGAAGHMAGHGVLGAAAGCAVGRHEANKSARDQKAAAQAASRNNSQAPASN